MDAQPPPVPTASSELPRNKRNWWPWIAVGLAVLFLPCLGLLAALLVPSLFVRHFWAQSDKARIDITRICQAVDTFTIENNGTYPESLDVLVLPNDNRNLPFDNLLDPWGNPYVYEPPAAERPYRVFSLGADGLPGGEGANADIDNLSMLADGLRDR